MLLVLVFFKANNKQRENREKHRAKVLCHEREGLSCWPKRGLQGDNAVAQAALAAPLQLTHVSTRFCSLMGESRSFDNIALSSISGLFRRTGWPVSTPFLVL